MSKIRNQVELYYTKILGSSLITIKNKSGWRCRYTGIHVPKVERKGEERRQVKLKLSGIVTHPCKYATIPAIFKCNNTLNASKWPMTNLYIVWGDGECRWEPWCNESKRQKNTDQSLVRIRYLFQQLSYFRDFGAQPFVYAYSLSVLL